MYIDVVDLRAFYVDRLGAITRRLITERLLGHWPDMGADQCLMGIGYTTPYLNTFRNRAGRILAFMPAAQGVVQ